MNFDELLERARSFQESRLLLTAIELDIFEAVGGGASAPEVAVRINAHPRSTETLLNALAAVGALTKNGETFRSSESIRDGLSGSGSQRAGLMHTVHLWDRWSTLTAAVRKGTAVWRRRREEGGEDWTEAFIAAMHRNALTRAAKVVRITGVKGVHRLLDVGGGSAAYSIAFAQAAPELHAEVLDRAEVLPIARRHIAAAGLEDRVGLREGDLRSDALGSGFDLILIFAICHMLSPDENRDLFRRSFRALAPGGRIAIEDFLLRPDKTAPRGAALFSLNMLVGTEAGASYSELEYSEWLDGAGFAEIRKLELDEPAGLMFGRKPR